MDDLTYDNYFIQLRCIPADYYEMKFQFKEYEMLLKPCE